jgi:xanthine/CO dehydrogenase XdhC/CoxF family maturation factor
VDLAKALGWQVGVADHRPAFAHPGRFPSADAVLLGRPAETIPKMALDARSAVVLLSHIWERDMEALRLLLPSPAGYLGLLGHRKRGAKLLEALAADGFEPAAGQLRKLYSPVGLDLGGQEPGEIALAVVAEAMAVLSDRTGGHLRDRKAPLHA